jgi:hypothetical protein
VSKCHRAKKLEEANQSKVLCSVGINMAEVSGLLALLIPVGLTYSLYCIVYGHTTFLLLYLYFLVLGSGFLHIIEIMSQAYANFDVLKNYNKFVKILMYRSLTY